MEAPFSRIRLRNYLSTPHKATGSRLETTGHDNSGLDEHIPVIDLTAVNTKIIETINEEDLDSKRPATYTNSIENEDPISRETFIRDQACDPTVSTTIPSLRKQTLI